jgi:hypothetical protein
MLLNDNVNIFYYLILPVNITIACISTTTNLNTSFKIWLKKNQKQHQRLSLGKLETKLVICA